MERINNDHLGAQSGGSKRPTAIQQKSIVYLIIYTLILVLLGILGMNRSSYAAGNPQGTHVQGTHVQGTHVQGTHVQGTHVQGTHVQGTHVQGTHVQGTHVQLSRTQDTIRDRRMKAATITRSAMPRSDAYTNEHEWLQGHRLIGTLTLPEHSAPTTVDIVGIRGDTVHAFVRDSGSRWSYVKLHPRELIGMKWIEYHCDDELACFSTSNRIAAVEQDTSRNTMSEYADNSDIWLYEVEYFEDNRSENRKNVCRKEQSPVAKGMFFDGRWDRDGSWSPGGYTFGCVTGVLAKCARNWGYKPWQRMFSQSGKAIALRPLHQACVRAARADYCGDGISHTVDGTLIDMFDIYGFNTREQNPGFVSEAAFTVNGARWVARKRWPTREGSSTAWSYFATCRRPKTALDDPSEPVLLHVWSSRRPLVKQGEH